MVHEAGLYDSAWSRRCEGRGSGVCGVAAGRGLDPLSLLKVRALWMVALQLVVLLGVRLLALMVFNTNLELKTKSCCGCGVAGVYWWCEMVAG